MFCFYFSVNLSVSNGENIQDETSNDTKLLMEMLRIPPTCSANADVKLYLRDYAAIYLCFSLHFLLVKKISGLSLAQEDRVDRKLL